jgi:virginiamycin A acetyltransferase
LNIKDFAVTRAAAVETSGIEIAEDARVSPLADIEASVRGSRIVVGPGAVIDAFVKIKPAGGGGDLLIGASAVINSGCVLYIGHGITIGAGTLIAANCTLSATEHACADPDRRIRDQGFRPSRGGVVIEDDVWIGANCVLLDGAHVGRGSVVGAASLVRGVLPPFCIAHGRPATVKGWRRDPGGLR